MVNYRFTALARGDLAAIARFTQYTWGEGQAQKYVRELLQTCARLSEQPGIGRKVEGVPGKSTLRFEYVSHVIFYRETKSGIVVSRILHKRMQAQLHLS